MHISHRTQAAEDWITFIQKCNFHLHIRVHYYTQTHRGHFRVVFVFHVFHLLSHCAYSFSLLLCTKSISFHHPLTPLHIHKILLRCNVIVDLTWKTFLSPPNRNKHTWMMCIQFWQTFFTLVVKKSLDCENVNNFYSGPDNICDTCAWLSLKSLHLVRKVIKFLNVWHLKEIVVKLIKCVNVHIFIVSLYKKVKMW